MISSIAKHTFFLLLGTTLLSPSSAMQAFYSYLSATCQDDYTIAGSAVLSYDNADLTALYGVLVNNYEGPCMYFRGGYVDIDAYNNQIYINEYNQQVDYQTWLNEQEQLKAEAEAKGEEYEYTGQIENDEDPEMTEDDLTDLFEQGFCTACFGVVGCSVDGTCDTFMSIINTNTDSGYQLTNSHMTNDELQAIRVPALNLQQRIRTFATTRTQSNSATTYQDGPGYYILGASVGLISILGLVAVLEKLRQRRVEHERDESFYEGMRNVQPQPVRPIPTQLV